MSKEDYFDIRMRGWIHNVAVKAHWRLKECCEVDDLVQEGYLCFCKCWSMYQHLFDVAQPSDKQRRHFMSLVQIAFINRLNNMSKRRKHERAVDYTSDWNKWVSAADEVATIMLLLRQAPAEIMDLVNTLTSDAFEPGPYRRYKVKPGRSSGFRLRETTREYWQRVLGEPDPEAKLISFFSP